MIIEDSCENCIAIYSIENILNNRIYIGSTVNYCCRSKDHLKNLKNKTHHNRFLQNDYVKCGTNSFVMRIVERFPNDFDKSKIFDIEQEYVDVFYDNQVKCYNIKKICKQNARSVYSNSVEETKSLLSEKSKTMWQCQEHRNKIKAIVTTEEYIRNQSEKQRQVSQNPNNGNSAYANKKRYEDPIYKEKCRQSLRNAWIEDDGARREKASILGKECNKKYTDLLMSYKRNVFIVLDTKTNEKIFITNIKEFCAERVLSIHSAKHGFSKTGRYKHFILIKKYVNIHEYNKENMLLA